MRAWAVPMSGHRVPMRDGTLACVDGILESPGAGIWLITDGDGTSWTVVADDMPDALALAIDHGMDDDPAAEITIRRDVAEGRRCVQYESEEERQAVLQLLARGAADLSDVRLITTSGGCGENARYEIWAWDRDWIRTGRGLLCGGES